MIIGMTRQLHDGMIDYDDGTPDSMPKIAFDMKNIFKVSNYIAFIQRRIGYRKPDKNIRAYMVFTGFLMLWPFRYLKTRAYFRNLLSVRWEMYTVRDGVCYNHFKKGGHNSRADKFRENYWVWWLCYYNMI